MDSKLTYLFIRREIRNIGMLFYFPIIIMIFVSTFVSIKYFGFDYYYSLPHIRNDFGTISMPLVSIWIINQFQPFVDTEIKEIQLSLPYCSIKVGIVSVLKMATLYIFIFLIFIFILYINSKINSPFSFFGDMYLPIISIYFFAALSFLVIVIIKKVIVCYILIGSYCLFQYMTRGAFSFAIYPFQWSFPQPQFDNEICTLILLITLVLILVTAQKLFQNREYLMTSKFYTEH